MTVNKILPPIALIDITQVRALVTMLNELEPSTYKYFEEVGIPKKILTTPHPYIPEIPIRKLIALVSEKSGVDAFMQISWATCRTLFIPHISQKIIGYDSVLSFLQRFTEVIRVESTQVELAIKDVRGKTYLTRHKQYSSQPWFELAELFSVAYMIELVRSVSDSDWFPNEISIQSCNHQLFQQLLQIDIANNTQIQIFVERAVCAIQIPDDILKRPCQRCDNWPKMKIINELPSDFLSSLKMALLPYLIEGKLSIKKAASLIGITVRTFQRRLDELGVNYTHVLESVLLQEAKKNLANKEITISNISIALGYSDTAHFSRAFKRLSGISPKVYRDNL